MLRDTQQVIKWLRVRRASSMIPIPQGEDSLRMEYMYSIIFYDKKSIYPFLTLHTKVS